MMCSANKKIATVCVLLLIFPIELVKLFCYEVSMIQMFREISGAKGEGEGEGELLMVGRKAKVSLM